MSWDIPKQTFLVENGQVGDCWRCCIAAILQVPATEVPHFLLEDKNNHGCGMDAATQKWLNDRGWALAYCRPQISFPTKYEGDKTFKGLPVIACGPTERSRGMGKHHAVVMVRGEMVYDPHPSNAGLTAVTDVYLVVPLPPPR